jgi:hypothetical protein
LAPPLRDGGGRRIPVRPNAGLRYGQWPLRGRLVCDFCRTRGARALNCTADIGSRFIFIALDNSCQLDFVPPDQPQIRPGHVALGTFSEVPVVKGNPSSQKFDTFHKDTIRRTEMAALIWIKKLGKRRCAYFAIPWLPILG